MWATSTWLAPGRAVQASTCSTALGQTIACLADLEPQNDSAQMLLDAVQRSHPAHNQQR